MTYLGMPLGASHRLYLEPYFGKNGTEVSRMEEVVLIERW